MFTKYNNLNLPFSRRALWNLAKGNWQYFFNTLDLQNQHPKLC